MLSHKWGSGTISEDRAQRFKSQRQGGPEQSSIFWDDRTTPSSTHSAHGCLHKTCINSSQTTLYHEVRRAHELTEELWTDDSFWGVAAGRWSTPASGPTSAHGQHKAVDGFLSSKVRTPSQKVGRGGWIWEGLRGKDEVNIINIT